ncbi:MAG: hypothetical protein JWO38_3943 [Gemmataceae bacterium]|nr:hypothetical protein [Gemmataceae bacterium]
MEEPADMPTQLAAAPPDIVLIPRTVFVPYAPYSQAIPAKLPTVRPAVYVEELGREASTEPKDVGAAAREALLTEALGQCLQQMKTLTARIADLESKLATRSASYPAPTARDAPISPVAPPLAPPAAIAPAGAFPRGTMPASIPATLPRKMW